MQYQSVVLTKRGTPDVLQIQTHALRDPSANEVRIKVLATGVGLTDVAMRYHYYPYAPKIPFVPGYEIIGIVDEVGGGVSEVQVGQRVAALSGHGGYAEYIYLDAEHLVPVPDELDTTQALALILNYVTAYQMLHRVAGIKAGDKVLITGASGGVGTALLQLGELAGLTMYGTASASKHDLLRDYGAMPIDYNTQDFVEVIQAAQPDGLDYVFEGINGGYIRRGFQVLKRGGKLIEYGYPSFRGMLAGFLQLTVLDLLPNGKSGEVYGITELYRKDKRSFMEDLPQLFTLLAHGKIEPVIATTMPILEAAKANALLESGQVRGKIVLLAPELL